MIGCAGQLERCVTVVAYPISSSSSIESESRQLGQGLDTESASRSGTNSASRKDIHNERLAYMRRVSMPQWGPRPTQSTPQGLTTHCEHRALAAGYERRAQARQAERACGLVVRAHLPRLAASRQNGSEEGPAAWPARLPHPAGYEPVSRPLCRVNRGLLVCVGLDSRSGPPSARPETQHPVDEARHKSRSFGVGGAERARAGRRSEHRAPAPLPLSPHPRKGRRLRSGRLVASPTPERHRRGPGLWSGAAVALRSAARP